MKTLAVQAEVHSCTVCKRLHLERSNAERCCTCETCAAVFTPEEIQKNRHRDECTRCELKDQIKRETRTLSDYRKQLEQLTHRRGFLEKTIPAHEMKIEQLKADLKAAPRRAKEKVAC